MSKSIDTEFNCDKKKEFIGVFFREISVCCYSGKNLIQNNVLHVLFFITSFSIFTFSRPLVMQLKWHLSDSMELYHKVPKFSE